MVLGAILVITTVGMTVDTTEVVTIAMMTGTTTDHTGAYCSLFSEVLQIIGGWGGVGVVGFCSVC